MNTPSVSRMLVWTMSLVVCLLSVQAQAQTQAQAQVKSKPAVVEGRVTLDFNNVELTNLIQTISELTGENFLYDETVRGKVTIVSPESMTLDESYQLFLTVLNVKGYTVVPSGNINKIVPLKDAKGYNLPTLVNGQGRVTEQVITRVFRLKHLDAAVVAPSVLIPLMPSTANVVAYAPSNSLIITDTGTNIERLAKIIHELDQPTAGGTIEIVPLQNSKADDLAKILNEVMKQPEATPPGRKRAAGPTSGSGDAIIRIIPYAAGSSLIVMASHEDMGIIKTLISQMDQSIDGASSNINLCFLENADAVTLAETLNEMLTGIKVQSPESKGSTKSSPATVTSSGGPLTVGQQPTGKVTITADKATNSLIVNATPDDYKSIKSIIAKLDIKRKQVYVEALILELSMDATQRLGVSLQGAGVDNGDSLIFGGSNLNSPDSPAGIGDVFSATSSTSSSSNLLSKAIGGMLAGGFFNPISVTGPDGKKITVPALSVLIDISKTDADVNLLSAPRLLTSDNEEAEIIVGSNVPIITGRLTGATASDSSTTGLAQSVSVERQDVALKLRFTPQINEGDLVRLNVYQEITDIAPTSSSVGDVNQVGPTFTKRVLRNTVLVEDHKTVVLGGLIGTNVTDSVTKVPLLGDIPVLGWLFKRTSTQKKKTNLLIFINPTIIKGPNDLEKVTGRNRKTALDSVTDKVHGSLPENFFDMMGDQNASSQAPQAESSTGREPYSGDPAMPAKPGNE